MNVLSSVDKKEEFIKASFHYLVGHGLENTSVRELCRETKIASGSMYYWFDGKEDIYISAVKYGISEVANALFKFVFETIADFRLFCDTFLDEIDKYKEEFRLIFQVTTSPIYGARMRTKADDFKAVYEVYIERLAKILSFSPKQVAPIVYLLISILVDYAIWEDRESSEMQLEFIYSSLKNMAKNLDS